MPAFQLSTNPSTLSPYDVVASGQGNLPTHAMLFIGESVRKDVTASTQVPVSHMRPPLSSDTQIVHFIGSAELDASERRLVKDFVDSQKRAVSALKLRQRIEQYAIHQENDDISPDDTLPRFSCATYVTNAYEQAAIALIDDSVPLKTLDDLKRTYTNPIVLSALDDPDRRVQIGIGNGTSWPIVMVGYLLHSLARTPQEIRTTPYRPLEGDENFPRQKTEKKPNLDS